MTALLLGGEMPHWSDSSPVRGDVLRELLHSVTGDTLVVGPHDPELVAAIGSRRVTVLVRGVPDAESFAELPGVRVCCGSLTKLAAVPAYDTVVALDGLDRTVSTEDADLAWSDGLAHLLAMLRPGGRLLLGHVNPLGLHRLYGPAAAAGDADWVVTAGDATRPAGLGALCDRLRESGLTVSRDYAAYPDPLSPTVLLSRTALADPDRHGLLTSVLRRAGLPGGPLLADPRPLAADLLRHDLAAALAPSWLVVAARPGDQTPPLPEILPAEPAVAGRCLHDVLLAAARSGDRPAMRALLTAWQSGDAAGVPADAIIVDAAGRLHPLAGPAGDPVLHRLAAALRDEGRGDETAELLAVMAGTTVTALPVTAPETLREVRAAHDRLAVQVADLTSQLAWYESRTASLRSELARADRIIGVLKGTVPGKAAKAVLDSARTGKRLARAAVRRIRR
ncbi:hypothetical protein [Actinoplanes derwentensis]|uniref:Methyltransferase domain-containing protein n=1 Tax=Actinoplanes derwentensis TaxID=113562 RepID=A0A1H2BLX8_9ACTN|nr:hypothetical protein [Actinoplanes derwentensis]GID86872.1 hypothetical protein Ade03nite_57960 [Actinoplanes derwentensis]SDT59295.1 hypothetical protein SAMN04489716_4728 [Actinoplanes derwentensis]